jgi:hypothetical protein
MTDLICDKIFSYCEDSFDVFLRARFVSEVSRFMETDDNDLYEVEYNEYEGSVEMCSFHHSKLYDRFGFLLRRWFMQYSGQRGDSWIVRNRIENAIHQDRRKWQKDDYNRGIYDESCLLMKEWITYIQPGIRDFSEWLRPYLWGVAAYRGRNIRRQGKRATWDNVHLVYAQLRRRSI